MNGKNDYEKLQLTKQDLSYLYSQILDRTKSKLDLHLPTANNDDPLKAKVANLLDGFIVDAFEIARKSMIIDGKDMASGAGQHISELFSLKYKEKVEPFNVEINAKLRGLLEHVDQETMEVTRLRRELPFRALTSYRELISSTDGEVSHIIASLEEELEKLNQTSDEDDSKLNGMIPKIDLMSDDYQTALNRMASLKKNIPEQKAELDKLNETLQFLEIVYRQQQKEASLQV